MTGVRVAEALRGWLSEGSLDNLASFPLRPRPPASLLAAGVVWIFALLVYAMVIRPGQMSLEVPETLSEGRYEFILMEDAQSTEYGLSVSAMLEAEGQRHRVQMVFSADEPLALQREGVFLAQERLQATASFRPFSFRAADRYAAEMLEARAEAWGLEVARNQGPFTPLVQARLWALGLFEGMEGRGPALLRAVLMGERSGLEEDGLYDSMKTVGLAHMVAVSGSHLAVIAALLSAAFARLPISRKLQAVLLSLLYAGYVVFTGLTAPVIRSAVMASIVVFSVWSGRRSSPLAALGVCVCVLLALQPQQALSLSFYLSAGSTLGVIVLTPLFSAWAKVLTAGRFAALAEAFAMTAAAGLPLLPVTVCVFARVSLAAPLANAAAAPVFTVLLAAGLPCMLLCAVFPSVGILGLHCLAYCAELFSGLCALLARMPYAALPASMDMGCAVVLAAALFVALWALWPQPRARWARMGAVFALAVFLGMNLIAPRFAGDRLIMLDVGQGDAFLIQSQGASLLVDTGNQDQRLLSALARQGVVALDGLLVTHHDDDHCGSLPVLDSLLAGGCVYLAQDAFACSCLDCKEMLDVASLVAGVQDVRPLACGDVLHVGRFSCRMVWPRAFSEQGGNADSVCLLLEYDADRDAIPEFRLLLTGDAEAEQIEEMLQLERIGGVDVFKAGHHGSRSGLNGRLAEALSPAVVLVSVGEGNSYGHPAPEVLEQCDSVGARVFRTDLHGDVTCSFKGSTMDVSVQNLR